MSNPPGHRPAVRELRLLPIRERAMTTGSLAGKVQTVLGPVSPDELGVTMMHEHVLSDLSKQYGTMETASARGFFETPVSIEILSRIRHYDAPNADNARLFDLDTAIEEVALYKRHGGGTIVELTSRGIARDPRGLAQVARATGVNLVMGASYYVAATHPADMAERSEEQIAEEVISDVTQGVGGTGVRSGIIGEIGCTWPLAEHEHRVLRASARAQRATGAALSIHPGRDEKAPMEIIEILDSAGADIGRIVMGHLDRTVFTHETLREIAQAGCYLEWDLFGIEESHYHLNPKVDMPSDAKRMNDIAWLLSQDYGRKVVVSHDVSVKSRLEKYGGHGYSYIAERIAPRMLQRGYTEQEVERILVGNPRDVLTLAEPRA